MTERLARGLALAVLALGIALRFVQLGADPYYYEWNGYITDEGRWIAHARALALFGEIGSVGSPIHLMLAPLYQAASYAVFLVGGVSLGSARIISAVSGSALLLVFWALARRICRPEALLLALAMLAVEMDLVVLSRIAIPEMAAMILTLLSFALLVDERSGRGRVAAAGLLMTAAVGMKATVLPTVAIFIVMLLVRFSREGELPRRRALVAFALGLLGPALVVAAAVFVACGMAVGPSAASTLRVIFRFVRPAAPYALAAFPFDDTLAPVLGVWTLAAWLGVFGWLVGKAAGGRGRGATMLSASLLWAGLFALTMLLLGYFPSRYKLHILVPLAVVMAVGITWLWREGGPDALGPKLAGLRPSRRAAASLVLALPTTIVLSSAVLTLWAFAGFDPERIRARYAVLGIGLVLVGALALRWVRAGRNIAVLVWFPLVWMGAWLVVERIGGVSLEFWPGSGRETETIRWLLLVIAVAGSVAARFLLRTPPAVDTALVAASILYVVFGLIRLAPGYLEPHYTMSDTSHDMGVLLRDVSGRITANGGEALFSDNRLRYRSLMGRRWPAVPPEVMVIAGAFDDPHSRLAREYRLIRQYTIYVSPEYVVGETSWNPTEGEFLRTNVRVYRRGG